MADPSTKTITAANALRGNSPLVLVAHLEPVAGLDRFQPAGFPEVGHVIYRAPRTGKEKDGEERFWEEHVCIVDSAASMANHLEAVCLRGAHDLDLVEDLKGMPYVRCVTGELQGGRLPPDKREVVNTSLNEGHRIASTYFLSGQPLGENGMPEAGSTAAGNGANKNKKPAKNADRGSRFEDVLVKKFGIVLPGSSKAHPPSDKWWEVFKAIFRYDPNALVHGVLFPQWQIKISRVLTAHLEATGASRVDRSGVKFDRLGKTTSGQPIFAVDDATAREIRATFILDLALVRSFGRQDGEKTLGLTERQKEFLVALALWKIQRLLAFPFRFRSGCHLQCVGLTDGGVTVELNADIRNAIDQAGFTNPQVTDVYWPREELYREGKDDAETTSGGEGEENGVGAEAEIDV